MKTPLLHFLKKAYQFALLSNKEQNPPADELADMYVKNEGKFSPSRRNFLKNTAKAGIGLGLASAIPDLLHAKTPPVLPRIAIIGGGIAGLTAAHYLKKAGINTYTIYEADNRVGGRIFTGKDIIGPNLYTEIGGEYIDTSHKDMFKLVKEYGLEMIDTFKDPFNLKKDAFFFEGRHYSLAEVIKEFQKVIPKITKDIATFDDEYTNEATQVIDNISLQEYFQSLNASSWFTKLLDTAYVSEYGMETSEQSPLNFLDMIDIESTTEFNVYGDSDERYKIKNGNGALTAAMSKSFQNSIMTGMQLTGVYSVGKRYLIVFNERQSMETDVVILTIPFTQLRNIPLQLDGITKVKKLCIDELGYGTNAKVMMGFNRRSWRTAGYMGYLFNESIHNGWDNGLFQNHPLNNATEGGYTVFLGGNAGLEVVRGNEQELARKYVGELAKVFPGIAEQYNGKAAVADWPQQPYVQGSYSCYKIGQWTTISGLEIEPVGNVYFAGEHCSDASQGYMNGGAETGRMAAQSIIKKIKGK